MGRVLGPGADQDIVRLSHLDLSKCDFVASVDLDFKGIVPKHLDQVKRERIIIVDDKESGQGNCPPKKKSHPEMSLGGLCLLHNSN